MRDDGDFFKSTRNKGQVVLYSNSCQCLTQIIPFVLHLMLLIFQGRKAVQRKSGSTGKSNFVEMRSFWHLFRSFDRLWTFYILALQVSSSSRNSKLLILLCLGSFAYGSSSSNDNFNTANKGNNNNNNDNSKKKKLITIIL